MQISVAPKLKKLYIIDMIAPHRIRTGVLQAPLRMRTVCFLLGLWLIPLGVFPQEAAMSDLLRRPERGEAPRYPQDLVIGELGQGETSDGAYAFARSLLSAVMAGRRDAPVIEDSGSNLTEGIFEEARSIRPRYFRLGGGRTEADGCVSYLLRFIGPEESISGELFLRWAEDPGEERWLLDDIILENKRVLSDIRDDYRYNFTPYERFY